MAGPNPSQQPVIIIRRKKKGGHGGHHGGAWKVAYADFVTAMMSFFLLLWLLNVTTDVQRKGIADYFSPASISKSESGAGGVMGGQTITENGAQMAAGSPPSVDDRMIPTVGRGDEGDEDVREKSQEPKDNPDKAQQAEKPDVAADAAKLAEAMKREEEGFKVAETVLKEAIQNAPELKEFADQILFDRTPEGLRIQIIDKDKLSLFPSGGSIPYERGRDLLRLVGKVIGRLPNHISVTGHTDSSPFSGRTMRDNWSLSSERANTSRAELETGGVPPDRVDRVVGLADRDPLVKTDPKDSKNRRISIVLLRQSLPPAELIGGDKAGEPAQSKPNADTKPLDKEINKPPAPIVQ